LRSAVLAAHLAGTNGALAPSHHGVQLANFDIPLALDLTLLVQLTATLPATRRTSRPWAPTLSSRAQSN